MGSTHPKSRSLIGFFRLEHLNRAGITAVESDYAGIASSMSTLQSRTLAYNYTEVSRKSFMIEVFRLDPKDENPVNVDLYRLTRTESATYLVGPTKPTSGHHLEDLPASVWERLPAGNVDSFHFPVASSPISISSSVRP